jgi:ATP-dependent helicase/nuclease subunit B
MIFTKNNIESGNIEEFISQKINSGKLNELLIIVPTNRKVRYLRKELISASQDGICSTINIDTIGTLSQKLFFESNDFKDDILSEAAAAVLLKQSFQEVVLQYFSNYKRNIPSGTLERIINVISHYKRLGISPEALKNEALLLSGSEKLKALDIAAIYERYNLKINELRLFEIGDIYSNLNNLPIEEFHSKFKKLYQDVDLIIIQGFDEFTSPEIEIINSVACVKDCSLYLELDYSSNNPMVFKHLESTFSKMIIKRFSPHSTEDKEKNKFRRIVRERLFLNHADKCADFESSLFEIRGTDKEKEVDIIAKEIKEIITRHNVKPQNICVVFNLISNYSQIIRDRFTMMGIPFNLTDRLPLKTSPTVISILNLFEILENDFYYNNIFRAFSGYILNSGNLDISNLRVTAVNLKIISGYKNWTDSIEFAILKSEESPDEGFNFDKKNYSKALNDIKFIYNLLSPFDKNLSAKEFEIEFLKIIESIGIITKMVNRNLSMEENVKSFNLFIETVKEILYLVELEHGTKKFPVKFYLNNIRTAVNSSRFNIREKPGYGVLVTNLNEIRGLEFDYLFIGGMTDGNLPTRYSPEIFFSGSFFKYEENHSAEERYHFYQSLCSWKKRLYLSFPSSDGNKDLSRSVFLNEFEELFNISLIDEKNYSDSIYSQEELLVHFGRNYNIQPGDLFKNDLPADINFPALKQSILDDQKRIENIMLPPESQIPLGTGNFKPNLNQEYSITQLETYAKCPYKYFAERILKLKPIEEPEEEIEGLELGSLIHSILYEFYTELTKKKIILSQSNEQDFHTAEDILFSIADKKINNMGFTSPLNFFEKEKILGINGNKKNSILYKFLLAEQENNDGFIPKFFEVGFGNIKSENSNKDNLTVDISTGSVKVRGKIDRIDINQDENSFNVIDYKLGGKKPSAAELMNGISLQLPLYMFAAKEIIKAQLQKDYTPAGAGIFSLKYKEEDFGKFLVKISDKKLPIEEGSSLAGELIKICLTAIEKYVHDINEGKFNLSVLSDRENIVCRFCGFRPVCRIQEIS